MPEADPPATSPEREQLAIPDYDHLPLGTLQHRVRTLEQADLEQLVAYEREHADRPHVLVVLDARLDQLRVGATPSGGAPDAEAPELATAPAAGSAVTPQTSGPPINPPSHGDPTNPAQPRSTG